MQQAEIIARKVAEIRPRFLAALSLRLDRLEEIRSDLETTSDPGPLLDEFRFDAHRTVGLAATLGFDDLGTLSQQVELAIMQRTEANPDAGADVALLLMMDDLLGEMALVVEG